MSLVRQFVGARGSTAPAAGAVRRRHLVAPEPLERRVLLAAFTVTTTADAGPGSLRQAILDANAAAGMDEVRFAIPIGAGVIQTIRPLSALPAVTGPTTIDGATQPGFTGKPVVYLDGILAGDAADGLRVTGGPTTLRGLAIGRFGRHGINIDAALFGSPVAVLGCHVGVDPEGDVAAGNGGAGVRAAGLGPVEVGGAAQGQRNVISANRMAGVEILRAASNRAVNVRGNFIGTNAAGSAPLGNGREGVFVADLATNVTIGGVVTANAGGGNLISGNLASGVRLSSGSAATVQSNLIGTDAFGARAVPNGQSPSSAYRDGVTAIDPQLLQVGGTSASLRNVISGNAGDGVAVIVGPVPRTQIPLRIQGNYIGADATGNAPIPNGQDGLSVVSASGPDRVILVVFNATVSGNLVSGNRGNGVRVLNLSGLTIAGNHVGTNAAGNAPLGNGADGIDVNAASLSVGGASPTSLPSPQVDPASTGRNVISANGGHGIHATASSVGVINSYVGTNSTGDAALGNGGHGIFFDRSSGSVGVGQRGGPRIGNVISGNRGNGVTVVGPAFTSSPQQLVSIESNRIGAGARDLDNALLGNGGHGVLAVDYTAVRVGDFAIPDSGNVIAHNGGAGVAVEGRETTPPAQPAVGISRNSIFSNGALGVDLVSLNDGATGVTPNDPGDVDQGPNGLVNHPTIISAVPTGAGTAVSFRMEGVTGRTYRVEFFSSPAPDPSGFGEGRTFLGFQPVTAGAPLPFTAALPAVPAGSWITATATEQSPQSMTSEFSPAVRVGTPSSAPEVQSRHVFYNNSAFDARNPSLGAADDAAIAPDKVALLPGQAPTSANVVSYDKGINGIVIDVTPRAAGAGPTQSDFVIRTGNTTDPTTWAAGPSPSMVSMRPGAGTGGTDRISLGWPGPGVVRNGWVEVTVLPSARTGLSRPDVFYFGTLTGDTGGPGTPAVTAADYAATRAALGARDATVVSRFDHNRDGVITVLDVGLVRANLGRALAAPYGSVTLSAPVSPAPRLTTAGVWEELEREDGA